MNTGFSTDRMKKSKVRAKTGDFTSPLGSTDHSAHPKKVLCHPRTKNKTASISRGKVNRIMGS
jgi:hypothetical protein